MAWEEPVFDGDADSIATDTLAALQEALPGWRAVDSDPLTVLALESARQQAATRAFVVEGLDVAAAVGIGATVFKVLPRSDAPAVCSDVALALQLGPEAGVSGGTPPTLDQSVTIASGFQVLADTGSDQIPFEITTTVTTTVTFTRQTTGPLTGYYTATLHVPMTATLTGAVGNVPPGTPATVLTAHPVVASATIDATATGGSDLEPLADYLDRFVDYVSLLRPGGVRGSDLAQLARTVTGVHRALGLDLYDPADGLYTHERTATIIAVDAAGQPVTSIALQTTLEAAREVNFVIHVGTPTYTSVDVVVGVTAHAGFDHTVVQAGVVAAVEALIDPASWGSSDDDAEAWAERTQLRLFDVVSVAARVAGVVTVDTVTLNGGTATVTLAGPGALPTSVDDLSDPSTVTVTVS